MDWIDILVLGVGLLLIGAKVRALQMRNRALRRLPPDRSGGVPVTSTGTDKLFVALFCVFAVVVICWLWLKML